MMTTPKAARSPPPSFFCRLWFSMVAAPKVEMTTQPVLANRVIRYGVLLGQVSALVKSKILKAINRQLVSDALISDMQGRFFVRTAFLPVSFIPGLSFVC